jgi:hypothetical protein
VNGVAKLELGRDSRRGKVLCLAVKYWLQILQMGKEELGRVCYEWQMNNLKFGSWAKKLSEELYIWQESQENSVSRTCKKI